jgi:hypothetical protein
MLTFDEWYEEDVDAWYAQSANDPVEEDGNDPVEEDGNDPVEEDGNDPVEQVGIEELYSHLSESDKTNPGNLRVPGYPYNRQNLIFDLRYAEKVGSATKIKKALLEIKLFDEGKLMYRPKFTEFSNLLGTGVGLCEADLDHLSRKASERKEEGV